MQVESEKPKGTGQRREKFTDRAETVRNALGTKRPYREGPRVPREKTEKQTIINFYGGLGLNIFEKASNVADPLTMWSALEKRELRLAVTHPPRNYFGVNFFNIFLAKSLICLYLF
jgi:hypothetical protein